MFYLHGTVIAQTQKNNQSQHGIISQAPFVDSSPNAPTNDIQSISDVPTRSYKPNTKPKPMSIKELEIHPETLKYGEEYLQSGRNLERLQQKYKLTELGKSFLNKEFISKLRDLEHQKQQIDNTLNKIQNNDHNPHKEKIHDNISKTLDSLDAIKKHEFSNKHKTILNNFEENACEQKENIDQLEESLISELSNLYQEHNHFYCRRIDWIYETSNNMTKVFDNEDNEDEETISDIESLGTQQTTNEMTNDIEDTISELEKLRGSELAQDINTTPQKTSKIGVCLWYTGFGFTSIAVIMLLLTGWHVASSKLN